MAIITQQELIRRFWERVDVGKPDECWEYKRGKCVGYGWIHKGKKGILTHRLSWEIHFGKIPSGMLVCHKCDNPPCVNPNHLFLGTHGDNTQDMVSKGRYKGLGEGSYFSKLTESEVMKIRRMYVTKKYTQKELAKKFNVTRRAIGNIVRGEQWKHLPSFVEKNPDRSTVKLTEDNVKEIRKLYASGDWTQEKLGLIYGVSDATIGRIVNEKSWKHI